MKTQYYTATSLDGFIATEDDSLEWLFPLGDVNDTSYPSFITEVGSLAMGASTYEWMLRNSTKVAAETGSAWSYTQPSWIFTHRDLPNVVVACPNGLGAEIDELVRAQYATAGLAGEVRSQRRSARIAGIRTVLESLGAPPGPTGRAVALVAHPVSAEAGIPLVDVHGLTHAEAGEAAVQAVEAIVADLRRAATPPAG